jgi:T5SS/PEP-CTERM-associated repeat protein
MIYKPMVQLRSFLVLVLIAVPAWATSLTWNGTTGNAGTSTKWSPQQVPVAADDLFFPGATAFTLTTDSSVPTVISHTYRNTVAATLTLLNPHTASGNFSLGTFSGDNPTVHLGTGSLSVGGTFSVADAAGSSGTFTVDGSDATLTLTGAGSDFFAGRGGNGTVSITGGGRITTGDDFIIGSLGASSGDVTVSGGTGSLPTITRSAIVTSGGTADVFVALNGDGDLHILDGAFVHSANDVKIATGSGQTGTVDMSGSFSIFGSNMTVDHNLDISRNDNVTAGGIASLTVTSPALVNVTGNTRIGDPNGGTGTLTLASGIISCDGTIDVQSNGNITGTGTINGNITNLGDITATGANGLTINGVLSNTTSNRITGTKMVFGTNGGYTGSGTCHADISGTSSSLITATGTLSIGANDATGFSYVGALDVGGNIVTLLDSNGAVLGGLTTINSGRIECPAGIGLQNGGTLQGDGLFVGDLTASGVVDPHTSNTLGGLFTVQGDLFMNPTGVFDMEIGGAPASSSNDRMNVSGAATFDGTMRVKLKNGYIPHVGEQFIAINAIGGRSGTFANIIPPAPAPCNNVTFVMVYSSTAAIVLVRPPLGCTALGDLNSDGSINGKDLQLFINDLLSPAYDACADMDGDCANDVSDIAIMVNACL